MSNTQPLNSFLGRLDKPFLDKELEHLNNTCKDNLRRDGKRIFHRRIKKLYLPIFGHDGTPLGNLFADRLHEFANKYGITYSTNEITAIHELATASSHFSCNFSSPEQFSNRGMRNLLAGFNTEAGRYSIFVTTEDKIRGPNILRALLLRAIITNNSNNGSMEVVDQMMKIIIRAHKDTQLGFRKLEFIWQNDRSTKALIDSLLTINDGNKKDADLLAKLVSPYISSESVSFVQADESDHAPTIITNEIRLKPEPSIDAPPEHEVPGDDLGVALTYDSPRLIEDDAEQTNIVSSTESTEVIDAFFEAATRQHLEGEITPDTNRSLTSSEVNQLCVAINSIGEKSLRNNDAQRLLWASCYLVMLVTCRERRQALTAIKHYIDPSKPISQRFSIHGNYWKTQSPKLPEFNAPQNPWHAPCQNHVSLPLPKKLQHWLLALKNSPNLKLDDLESSESALVIRDNVFSELKRGCPRLSETRLFHSLPVQFYSKTASLRDTQWLAGSDLCHSTASLHYYCGDIIKYANRYTDCLKDYGIGEVCSGTPQALDSFGAPRASIDIKCAQKAIAKFSARIEASEPHPSCTLEKLINHVNQLCVYTAVMFGATTAHRWTKEISQVSLSDLYTSHGTCIAIVHDKGSNEKLDSRVCALPPLLISQIHAYIKNLERLQKLLQQKRYKKHGRLKRRINSSLSGTAPLFFITKYSRSKINTEVLDKHSAIQEFSEWKISLAYFRHLFASNIDQCGIHHDDIALQMGHSVGAAPFDDSDPDCPIDFAIRVSAYINKYLLMLGFRNTQTDELKKIAFQPKTKSAGKIITAHKATLSALGERNSTSPTITKSDIEQARNEIIKFLNTTHHFSKADSKQLKSAWLIAPEHIDVWRQETVTTLSLPIQWSIQKQFNTLAIEALAEQNNQNDQIPATLNSHRGKPASLIFGEPI